jgi:thioredoxin-related protein
MKSLFTFLIATLISTNTLPWGLDFDAAQTQAAQSHKLILLNFSGSDWCGPCIKLKQDVFESEIFQQYAQEKLILVRADFPRLKKNQLAPKQTTHNEALAEKYNSEGKFPLTVLLDEQGKKIHEWDGYPKSLTPLQMVNDIRSAVTPR